MHFSKSLVALVAAVPALVSAASEIVYLVNCNSVVVNEGDPWDISGMAYYSDQSKSLTGLPPTAWTDVNWVIQWEGDSIGLTFADGDVFTSHINAGSWTSFAQGAVVGWGQNKYRTMTCYKDSGRFLFTRDEPALDACYSLYYCW